MVCIWQGIWWILLVEWEWLSEQSAGKMITTIRRINNNTRTQICIIIMWLIGRARYYTASSLGQWIVLFFHIRLSICDFRVFNYIKFQTIAAHTMCHLSNIKLVQTTSISDRFYGYFLFRLCFCFRILNPNECSALA